MAVRTFSCRTFGSGGGSGTAPSAPTLAVVDNADGTGATATISGGSESATNSVRTERVDSGWNIETEVESGSRSGNGDVDLALTPGAYWAHVLSTTGGGTAVSNTVFFYVTTGNEAVYKQILTAIQAKIILLELEDVLAANIVVQEVLQTREGAAFPRVVIAPYGSEEMDPNAGTNLRDDTGYPVIVGMADKANQVHDPEKHAKYLLWRQRVKRAFMNQRLGGVQGGAEYRTVVVPQNVTVPFDWARNFYHSPLLLKVFVREVRGLGN